MADLLGNDIGLNYKGLLNLDTTINTGLDGTLRVVTDGEGDSSPLYLSTTAIGLGTTSIWDNTNGRLGIGTTSPSYKLHVKTTTNDGTVGIGLENSTKGSNVISLTDRGLITGYSYNSAHINYHLGYASAFNSGALTLFDAGVEKVFFAAASGVSNYVGNGGKFGINNISPTAQLDIVAASSTVGLYVKGAAGTDIARFYQSDGTTNAFSLTSTGNATFAGGVNSAFTEVVSAGYYSFSARSYMTSGANGNIELRNNAGSDFGLLKFGGTTSSFPSLKRSTTNLQVRLADDSGYAPIDAASYKVNGNAGFTGTGIFTTLTIEGGIITAAS